MAVILSEGSSFPSSSIASRDFSDERMRFSFDLFCNRFCKSGSNNGLIQLSSWRVALLQVQMSKYVDTPFQNHTP